ncbi:BlaI/MecI/CopY family transcriptional regulator [Planctomycetota bacterium]
MKKKTPRISEAEWQVMEVLWSQSPLTTRNIVEILTQTTSWKRETIRTLISRLVQKKALDFKQKGRLYFYYPIVDEDQCLQTEAKSFLSRFNERAVEPILSTFVEQARLSPEQIKRLRRILQDKGKKNA